MGSGDGVADFLVTPVWRMQKALVTARPVWLGFVAALLVTLWAGGVFGSMRFYAADGRLALNYPKDKAAPLADWLIAQGAAYVSTGARLRVFGRKPALREVSARLPKKQE